MNQSIELHDSELAILWHEQNGAAILIFSKLYIHQSNGSPGIDRGTGWFQRAELVIENASLTEHFRAWPCQVFGGEIVIDGVTRNNVASLPLNSKKHFKLTLNVIDDETDPRQIEIVGTGVSLTLLGAPGKSEEFSGLNQK